MTPRDLYALDRAYVVTVLVPEGDRPWPALAWGSRLFVLQPDGVYVETLVWHVVPGYGLESQR